MRDTKKEATIKNAGGVEDNVVHVLEKNRFMTQLIDGTKIKGQILTDLKETVAKLDGQPGLAVILVGDNPASKAYIGMKKKACENLGIQSYEFLLPETASEDELINVIDACNENPDVNGILLQMPLPKGFDEQKMLERILPEKDVDGFHPVNVGKLLIGLETFKSCTPYGVAHLLQAYNIDTEGKHVVVIGRSNIVGKKPWPPFWFKMTWALMQR